jgi:predicted nucleic acid-binding protein
MQNERLIPDSTFFSFFLHNVDEPDFLKRIVHNFYVEVPPRINEEVKNCKNAKFIDEIKDRLHIFEAKLNFTELLKPLFSNEQKQKGEHDVIVVGYFCYELGIEFLMIIDDLNARKFVSNNFPYLNNRLTWTATFIRDCYSKYQIFKKDESIALLNKMAKSTFRIDKQTLSELMEGIKDD